MMMTVNKPAIYSPSDPPSLAFTIPSSTLYGHDTRPSAPVRLPLILRTKSDREIHHFPPSSSYLTLLLILHRTQRRRRRRQPNVLRLNNSVQLSTDSTWSVPPPHTSSSLPCATALLLMPLSRPRTICFCSIRLNSNFVAWSIFVVVVFVVGNFYYCTALRGWGFCFCVFGAVEGRAARDRWRRRRRWWCGAVWCRLPREEFIYFFIPSPLFYSFD